MTYDVVPLHQAITPLPQAIAPLPQAITPLPLARQVWEKGCCLAENGFNTARGSWFISRKKQHMVGYD